MQAQLGEPCQSESSCLCVLWLIPLRPSVRGQNCFPLRFLQIQPKPHSSDEQGRQRQAAGREASTGRGDRGPGAAALDQKVELGFLGRRDKEGRRLGWGGASVLGPRSQACVDEVPPRTHCEGAVTAEEALGTSLALPVHGSGSVMRPDVGSPVAARRQRLRGGEGSSVSGRDSPLVLPSES